MKNLAPLLPNVELSDDAILKSLDKYRPDAYFDGSRPVGGGTTDDINDLRDYYRYDPKLGYGAHATSRIFSTAGSGSDREP